MKEIWKEIDSYNDYEISNFGRVYSKKTKRILKPYTTKKGYKRIGLYKNGSVRKFLVHVLVAEKFLVKPNDNYQVNHKNLDKSDNHVGNLEWVTGEENVRHIVDRDNNRMEYLKKSMSDIGKKYGGIGIEASKKPVVQIDKDTDEVIDIFESAREASRETGANYKNISQVCRGTKNTHMGYGWKFYNQ